MIKAPALSVPASRERYIVHFFSSTGNLVETWKAIGPFEAIESWASQAIGYLQETGEPDTAIEDATRWANHRGLELMLAPEPTYQRVPRAGISRAEIGPVIPLTPLPSAA